MRRLFDDHLFQSWANSHFEGQEIMGVVMIGAFLWMGKELAQKRFFRGSIAAIVFAWGFYYFAVARFECPCGYGG